MAIKNILPHEQTRFSSSCLLLFSSLEFVEYRYINPLSSTFANMKLTLILALASVFTSVISAPTNAPETDLSIEKRQADATSIITTLNAAIAGPIASIRTSHPNPLAYKTPR
jgi:hypothetical protein